MTGGPVEHRDAVPGGEPRASPSFGGVSNRLRCFSECHGASQPAREWQFRGHGGRISTQFPDQSLVSLQQEQDALRRELLTEQQIAEDARAALEDAEVRLARRNEELLDLRAYKRRTQPALKRALAAGSDALFATAGERLRHDVYLAWAKNVPASEKARQPLPADWTAGPEFAG